MDEPRMLSGEELVNRGVTRTDATLPELGLKDVHPNGSWLEQKQIQSALEARKHLIGIERIEKSGTLTQAEWRDDLKLAEVTHQMGGYWQFMGHHIGKKLYLNPEEALFLIETNCLQLKHDEVQISLQKAYSLLLSGDITITQYKVYASLSRLGYKVFRHNVNILKDNVTKDSEDDTLLELNETNILDIICSGQEFEISKDSEVKNSDVGGMSIDDKEKSTEPIHSLEHTGTNADSSTHVDNTNETASDVDNAVAETSENQDSIHTENGVKDSEHSTDGIQDMDIVESTSSKDDTLSPGEIRNSPMEVDSTDSMDIGKIEDFGVENPSQITEANSTSSYKKYKSHKLQTRQPTDTKSLSNSFRAVPNMYRKTSVTIWAPSEDHIPKNVFTNKISYEINMSNIKLKSVRSDSIGASYSSSDDVNNSSLRRIRSDSNESADFVRPVFSFIRFPTNVQYRQFNTWRPYFQTNFSEEFHCDSIIFQRPFVPNTFNPPRFQFISRHMGPMFRPFMHPPRFIFNSEQSRTRFEYTRARNSDGDQQSHLESIKTLVAKLKRLIASGNTQTHNVRSFYKILRVYNKRYKTKLRLNSDYDLVDDQNVVETIEIEDDTETPRKKPRMESKNDYSNNLSKLRKIAFKLKMLVLRGQAAATHRRAFSNAMKVFNKSYSADLYLNEDFELLDRSLIAVDSSSDSDCVVDEAPTLPAMRKLRNPFSILKALSEISVEAEDNAAAGQVANEESKTLFNSWISPENDFGRPEVVPKCFMKARILDTYKQKYMYDFYYHRQRSRSFDSWVDLKISFLAHIDETVAMYQNEQTSLTDTNPNNEVSVLSPIIKPEDCSDMPTLLEKLRVISTNKDIDDEVRLSVHFDVYNRDVQNFRKSSPPKPHFRVICTEESTNLPTSPELLALQSKYTDKVPTVFAIAGTSVSYLQINNINLPIYNTNNDLISNI